MSDMAPDIIGLLDTWAKLKQEYVEKHGINPEYWRMIRDKDGAPVDAVFVNGKHNSLPGEHANLIEDAIKDTLPQYFEERLG